MEINIRNIPARILELFIIIAPLENIFRIEQVEYLIGTFLLFILLLNRMSLKYNFALFFFFIDLLLCCLWSPANDVILSAITKFVVFLFLILIAQFNYTENDYKKIKNAFIIQGFVLLGVCFLFSDFQYNRMWISSSSSSADPNYLSTWFIFPIVFICDRLLTCNDKGIRKVLLIFEVIAMYACILVTASRSGFITNTIILLLYIAYTFRNYIKKNLLKSILLIVFSGILCIIIINSIPDYLSARLMETHSMGTRGRIWEELFAAMGENPLQSIVGFGDGATVFYNTEGRIYGLGGLVAHNTFIDVLFNNGCIGLVFFLVMIIRGITRSYYEKRIEIVIGALGMCIAIFTLSALTTRPVTFMLILLLIDIKIQKIRCE